MNHIVTNININFGRTRTKTKALNQAFVCISDNTVEKQNEVMWLKRVKGKDTTAKEKRCDQMKRRVFSSGANEDNTSILNNG
jgi:ribonuclease HI